MDRTFTMISTGLVYNPLFQALKTNDKLLLLIILISEAVNLKGFGKTNVIELAEASGLPAKAVKSSLRKLEEVEFVAFNTDEQMILIRDWWSHTHLTRQGLPPIVKQLQDGRLKRLLRGFEMLWLNDFAIALDNAKVP